MYDSSFHDSNISFLPDKRQISHRIVLTFKAFHSVVVKKSFLHLIETPRESLEWRWSTQKNGYVQIMTCLLYLFAYYEETSYYPHQFKLLVLSNSNKSSVESIIKDH